QLNNRKYHGLAVSTAGTAQLEPLSVYAGSRIYDPTMNNEGFSNERYAQLVTAAASEPDTTKRKQIYADLNTLLLDECFAVPLSELRPKSVTRAAVHDVGTVFTGAFSYSDTWLE